MNLGGVILIAELVREYWVKSEGHGPATARAGADGRK